MSLDLFNRDADDSVAYAARHSAPDLPVDFSGGMSEAWETGYLTAQSISGANRRAAATSAFIEDAIVKTGDRSLGQLYTEGGGFDMDGFNARIVAHKTSRPDLDIQPMSTELIDQRADDLGRSTLREARRNETREFTMGGRIGSLVGAGGAALTDPVNVVAFPLAAPEALGIMGTAMAWSAIGGGSQAAIEALNAPAMERIQPGYSESGEPLGNIAEAAVFAGALGGGLKGLSAAWTRYRTGSWPRTVRDAGNVVDSEAQIEATNRFPGAEGEAFHRTALQTAIDDLVAGRPVFDQRPLPEGGILAAYDAKIAPIMESRAKAAGAQEAAIVFERDAARLPGTMERLSEVQLAEFRAATQQARETAEAARAGVAAERTAITTERAGLGERVAGITALEDNAAGLRADIERVQQRIADARPPSDPATQARLDAIEADLKAPQLAADARTRLEAERAQITETLAKTSPEDRRLIASLQAEQKGLEKALKRAETAVAKGQASIARTEARLGAREQAIPRREATIAEREAARSGAAENGLRRAVARLAEDGYGLRLPRDDAEAMAARILGATDQEADAVLRDITEQLVTRAVELRAGTPEIPGIGRPAPAAEQRARAGYWTEEMRKQITAVAREVGYEMPREEAATIAARIAGMSDQDAMAVLDELMLRPRALVDTLPGTRAAEPVADRPVMARPGQAEAVRALADEVTPERIAELRTDADMADTISRDLDKLVLGRGDFDVPVGVTQDADGKLIAATRKVSDVFDEAARREAAAKEIMACAGPLQTVERAA